MLCILTGLAILHSAGTDCFFLSDYHSPHHLHACTALLQILDNSLMAVFRALYVVISLLLSSSAAQSTCDNYASQNGSACLCPPGFGGDNCAVPSCGGNIFQGRDRPLASGASGNFSGCECQDGWGGAGCNLCQRSDACQTGYNSAFGTTTTINASGLDGTLQCNSGLRVYAAGQMSCQVIVSITAVFLTPFV